MAEEKHVGREIMTLSNRFRRYMDNGCAKYGITRMQSLVLRYLEKSGVSGEDVYQKDIEKAFCVRRSTASNLLGIMEKNGLISRECSEKDARMKKIVFTDKGRAVQDGMHNNVISAEESISALLSAEEKEALFGIIEKLNGYFINEERLNNSV